MMKQSNVLTGSVLVLLAAGLMGCGQSFQSAGSAGSADGSSGNGAVSIEDEMSKAEAANDVALHAMDLANEAMLSIMDENGKIKIDLFKKSNTTGGVQSKFLATPIINKLRPVFDNLFTQVTMVKMKFAEARNLLLQALAKLDVNKPEQAAMAAQIMTQLGRIDAMEAQFRSSMVVLAGKLDMAVVALDKVVSGITNFIPGFGWVVDLLLDFAVMNEVKAFIGEIKFRLLAL